MNASPRRPLADLVGMTKPGIAVMVLVTTAAGFLLGRDGEVPPLLFYMTLLGVGLSGCASSVLNQVMEREFDSLMERTRGRPLPCGRLPVGGAALFGVALGSAGVALLLVFVHPLCAWLTAGTLLTYLFVYTPLKRLTPLNTIAGALPGAMPPLLGWVAASGRLDPGAWMMFIILFLWQLPHFLSIAWLYREDYRRGGYRMLTLLDDSGELTGRRMTFHTALLILVSLLPVMQGLAGPVYLVGSLLVGGLFFRASLAFWRSHTDAAARVALGASLAYLPVVYGLLAVGM